MHHVHARWRKLVMALISLVLFSSIWLLQHRDPAPAPGFVLIPGRVTSTGELGKLIPPRIWQIFLSKTAHRGTIPKAILEETVSWISMNPDHEYMLVSDEGADAFLQRHFASDPDIIETYRSLANVGMKSDFLRYLLLSVSGGVYTDTDTEALQPIDSWVPEEMRPDVRLVVGIEFDRRGGHGWADISHSVQFCQWTIAAAPGHPVFEAMIRRVQHSVKTLSTRHGGRRLGEFALSSFDVMNSTGPAAWTDVVFEQLGRNNVSPVTADDLSFMTQPTRYGDILVVPIDGFGMGQAHSDSTDDGTIPEAALARHLFRGTWRDAETEQLDLEEKIERMWALFREPGAGTFDELCELDGVKGDKSLICP